MNKTSIRVSGIDSDFSDRLNDDIMTFTKDDLNNFAKIILRDIYDQ